MGKSRRCRDLFVNVSFILRPSQARGRQREGRWKGRGVSQNFIWLFKSRKSYFHGSQFTHNPFVSSETESAKGEEPAKDETDEAAIEDGENGEIINNNTKKSSMSSRVTSLLSAMKKQVSRKEKYSEASGESGEVNTPVSID